MSRNPISPDIRLRCSGLLSGSTLGVNPTYFATCYYPVRGKATRLEATSLLDELHLEQRRVHPEGLEKWSNGRGFSNS